jgi:hypothetical protein
MLNSAYGRIVCQKPSPLTLSSILQKYAPSSPARCPRIAELKRKYIFPHCHPFANAHLHKNHSAPKQMYCMGAQDGQMGRSEAYVHEFRRKVDIANSNI